MKRSRTFAAVSVVVAMLAAAACGDDDPILDEAQREALSEQSKTATAGTAGDQTPTAPVTRPGGRSERVIEIPAAEQGLAFAKQRVATQAGVVTLSMPNPADLQHNIAVDQPERQQGDIVGKGGVSEITVDFPAGEYEYYCSVPGHREGGMVGTLVVN